MYRFWPGFEPSRLTPGREPDGQDPVASRRTTAAVRPPNYRTFVDRPSNLDARELTSSEAAEQVRPPEPGPSQYPAGRASRSSDMTMHGFRLLGMSGREVRMYLTFVQGPRGAREAAEESGLHRATGYRVLLRLLDRGLITSNGRSPRRFEAVAPASLFHRLELSYQDETEIPGCFAEAFGRRVELRPTSFVAVPSASEPPRILAPQGKSLHPAIAELSQAKRSVAAIVRPQSTPVAYRNALARTLGHLARGGVHIRLITDAMPADYRFWRAAVRESGGASASIQVRHYCPIVSQLYSIDRQTIVRIPTLGTSNRAPPVGVAITDRGRVQALGTRFESMWSAAAGIARPSSPAHEPARPGNHGEAPPA